MIWPGVLLVAADCFCGHSFHCLYICLATRMLFGHALRRAVGMSNTYWVRNSFNTCVLACVFAFRAARGATFYLDSVNGRDANDGQSAGSAWQTIDRANARSFAPGDRLLLRRGCEWHGPGFKAQGSGTAERAILVGDYGDSSLPRPVIDGVGPHEPAVLLLNVQNWVIQNLDLTQHGQTPQALDPNNEKGKDADQSSDEYMRAIVHVLALGPAGDPACGGGCTVRNIRLENLSVHDGSWNGVYGCGGYYQLRSDRYGFLDTFVVSGVESFNNHKAGVEVTCTYYQDRVYAASNVWVLGCHLHHNGGDGAMVGPVRNALLDGNLCESNGQIRNARVGCWTWDSENTTIQFNESRFNMTPLHDGKARDGAGFDLDLGTEDGVIQYNWSHDNEGEGFLVVSWPVGYGYSRGASHNAVICYNVSERDGKKLAGGITVFGGVAPLTIHNNTIYYEPDRLAGTDMFNGEGGALTTSIFGKSGKPDVRVYNNVFVINGRTNTSAVSNMLWTDGAGTFTFHNNIWWRLEGGMRFDWNGAALTSWGAWQANGFDADGYNMNPAFTGGFGRGPSDCQLLPDSPAIDHGQWVPGTLRGMGVQDAFGASVPQGSAWDIGANEYRMVHPDPASPWLSPPVRQPDGSWVVLFTGQPARAYAVQTSGDAKGWTHAGLPGEYAAGCFLLRQPPAPGARFFRATGRGIPGG
jgi:hypothetical protein